MSGIKNYVLTIEQGEKTGFHLHVILYYSAKHRRDVSLAQRIGEYWANVVTEEKGDYWNSNARKIFHARHGHGIGTGQIDWNDELKRESLRKNLLYLAKASQYLMIKSAQRIRTFDMGQVPKKVKEGRRRVEPRRLLAVSRQESSSNVLIGSSNLRIDHAFCFFDVVHLPSHGTRKMRFDDAVYVVRGSAGIGAKIIRGLAAVVGRLLPL
jgi:hypothetical protein